MLKRHQVLLEDWQVEYIQVLSAAYDVSLSEALRVVFSIGTLFIVDILNPEYKSGLSKKEIGKKIKKGGQPATSNEEKHKYISQLYFEARKATEYRLAKLKKKRGE